jgi:hypothetical protein
LFLEALAAARSGSGHRRKPRNSRAALSGSPIMRARVELPYAKSELPGVQADPPGVRPEVDRRVHG